MQGKTSARTLSANFWTVGAEEGGGGGRGGGGEGRRGGGEEGRGGTRISGDRGAVKYQSSPLTLLTREKECL